MTRKKQPAATTSHPTHIISNMAYVKYPKEMLGKLRYYQYRDDKHDHISHAKGKPRPKRWIDRGLGDSYRTIFRACKTRQSDHVLAWTFVISPDPELMDLVPERHRRKLMATLTETIIEAYYEARDEDVPPYSYVIHDRDTVTGKQQLHTHIVLPGTVETLTGNKAFYNNRRDGHVDLFNRLSEEIFEHELTEMGIERQTPLSEIFPPIVENQTQLSINLTDTKLRSKLDEWFGSRD